MVTELYVGYNYTRFVMPRWVNIDNRTVYDRFMGTYINLTVDPDHSFWQQNRRAMIVVEALNRIYQ